MVEFQNFLRQGRCDLRAVIAAALFAASLAHASSANAQDATADKSEASDAPAGGNDIIVTAQRREERLQDVPISVSVIGGDSLQAFSQNSTVELAYRIPNVSLNNGAAARQFGFFIRGYGSTSFAPETIESSTAFVLDGVVLGMGGGALMDLPDIERIEVLRGPQGTLFGKNSGAGVVNVTTRRPSSEPVAEVRASIASPQFDRQFSIYSSAPLSDAVRYSLSFRGQQRNGFIKNVFDGRRLNDENNYGFRGRLEIEPSSDLTVTLIGDYWERDSDCCLPVPIRAAATPVLFELEHAAAGIQIRPGNMKSNIDGYVFSKVYSYGMSAAIDYSFNDYTLTSISSYRGWGSNDGFDLDNRPVDIFNINSYYLRQKQFSQELRVASPKGKMFDFVAGLFYFNQSADGEEGIQINRASTAFLVNRTYAALGRTENLGIFGQTNINLSDDFRIIVGARWLKENIRIRRYQTDLLSGRDFTVGNSRSDDAIVWRLGAQYDISDDVNFFATATRGFKGGGFDSGPVANIARDVLPERPMNYEVGLRSVFRDAGVTFNVTGFWQKIDNLQVTARDPNNVLNFFLLNAATARTRGFEWELSWRPSRDLDLSFDLAGSYTDAKFTDFPSAPCYRGQTAALGCVGGVQNLTGARLPYAEKWNISLTTNLSVPIGGGLKMMGNAFVGYKSAAFLNAGNDPGFIQPGYPLVHLSLGVGDENDKWHLRAFVRNLTDEVFAQRTFATTFGGVGSFAAYYPYEARRIIGVSGGYRF
jgi:iron complex outermembrane recepter protein